MSAEKFDGKIVHENGVEEDGVFVNGVLNGEGTRIFKRGKGSFFHVHISCIVWFVGLLAVVVYSGKLRHKLGGVAMICLYSKQYVRLTVPFAATLAFATELAAVLMTINAPFVVSHRRE